MADHKHTNYPHWHNAVAGGIAGAGSRVATAPLDLIRIRRQLSPRTVTYPSESILTSWINIVRNEGGITALFRGNVAAINLWIGYSAVQFALYNHVKAVIKRNDPGDRYHTATTFFSGAVAGLGATLTTYPFDVMRTAFAARGLMQKSHHVPFSSLVEPDYRTIRQAPAIEPPKTLLEFAVQVYSNKGLSGFYAGCGPAAIQIIPYMGLNFMIYDFLTRGDRRVALSAYAGSISGAVSKIVIYPIDTVKRRLQAQSFFVSERYYRNASHCISSIAKEEGLMGFYKGAFPSVLKTTISSGLTFALFRSTKNLLEHLHDDVSV